MRVAVCPCCGEVIRDNPFWRGSRYDFNADYMRFEDGQQQPELKEVCEKLEDAENFEPLVVGPHTFYRRGKGGKWLYRVPSEDFRVETEKRKPKGKQLKLPMIIRKLASFDDKGMTQT
jgi:hypothetical protein